MRSLHTIWCVAAIGCAAFCCPGTLDAESTGSAELDDPTSPATRELLVLYAQKFKAEGDEAAKHGSYDLALAKYIASLKLDPENADAADALANVQAVLDRRGPVPTSEQITDSIPSTEQQTKAQYKAALERADAALKAGNFAQARDAVASAKTTLDTNREAPRESNYVILRQIVCDLSVLIDRAAEEGRLRRHGETETGVKLERERAQEIQQLLQRARALQQEMQYAEALELLDELLFLDPQNVPGKAMKEMVEDMMLIRRSKKLYQTRKDLISHHSVEVTESTLPPNDILSSSPNWPELTRVRIGQPAGGQLDTKVDQRVRQELQHPIPISFEDNTLDDVLDYVQTITGVNVFPDWPALEAKSIDQDTRVTMKTVQPISASTALDRVLESVSGEADAPDGLGWTVLDGAVVISTPEQLSRRTVTLTYDLRDLLGDVWNSSDVDGPLERAEPVGQDAGVAADIVDGDVADAAPEKDGRALLVMQLIMATVDPDSWGVISYVSPWGDEALIITTTRDNHRGIHDLFDLLRTLGQIRTNAGSRSAVLDRLFLEEVLLDIDLAKTMPGGAWPADSE